MPSTVEWRIFIANFRRVAFGVVNEGIHSSSFKLFVILFDII